MDAVQGVHCVSILSLCYTSGQLHLENIVSRYEQCVYLSIMFAAY